MRRSRTTIEAEAHRRFTEVIGAVMAQETADSVRRRAVDALAMFIPYDACDVRAANDQRRELIPVLSRGVHAAEVMLRGDVTYGHGLTGWVGLHREALLTNSAQLDPRAVLLPGTASTPEAVIGIPLVAGGRLKDVFLVRRQGYRAFFTESEFTLAQTFGDMVAIALENADVRARLEQQANTDPLTGLPNRRYFTAQLGRRATAAQQEDTKLSVLLIDVDGLKLTNDTLGHHEGDRLLVALAQTLSADLRQNDLAARLAGDEFAVLLSHTAATEATMIAQRLGRSLTSAAQAITGLRTVGASVGWAELGSDGRDAEELLIAADKSMYAVKRRNHRQTRRSPIGPS